jgi:hypothetical protein
MHGGGQGEASRRRRSAGPRIPGRQGSPGKSRWGRQALALTRSRDIALPIGVFQRLARRGDIGGVKVGGSCERFHGCVIAQDEIEHAAEKMRIGRSGAQGLRTDSAFGQEQAQPLGVARDKGKRLNGNNFSYFPGVVNRLSQLVCLPFRNLWSLFWNPSCPSLRNVFKQLQTASHKDGIRA